jgi:hypothetical protein
MRDASLVVSLAFHGFCTVPVLQVHISTSSGIYLGSEGTGAQCNVIGSDFNI